MLPPQEPTSNPRGKAADDASFPIPSRAPGIPLEAVARAATRGIQVYPSVASAEFCITGNPLHPDLTVTLVFTPALENQRIKDEINYELIPGLEAIIGARFSRVTLDYSDAAATTPQAPVTAA